MFSNRFKLKKLFLLGYDFIFLQVALFLSLKIRFFQTADNYFAFKNHFLFFVFLFVFWLLVFYLFDLYEFKKIKSYSFLFVSFAIAIFINVIVSMVFFYVLTVAISPKTLLIILALISFILLFFWRCAWLVFNRSLRPKMAIVANFDDKLTLLKDILYPAEMEYEIVGFVTIGQENSLLAPDYRILGNYVDLQQIIERERIDELICAFNYYKHLQVTTKISQLIKKSVNVNELSLFYEEATGKVPVDYIDQIWFLSQLKRNKKNFEVVIRFVDFVLALICFLILLPVMVVVAIAVKISSPGKIFYTQKRVGKNEKIFNLYKFRSMVDNAEKHSGAVWAADNDSRITVVGKFLRKTRLDELPQLFNVLRADMSLVGPRPERPEFVSELEKTIRHYGFRHLTRPGLTGWAQIKYKYGNSINDSQEKLQYDLYYIKNRSFLLYLSILVRTLRIVVTQKGK